MHRTLRLAVPSLCAVLVSTLAACGGVESRYPNGAGASARAGTSQPPHGRAKPEPAGEDRTGALRFSANGLPWSLKVRRATETEPGRLEVQTRFVDPSGAARRGKTLRAVQICRAAVFLLQHDGVHKPRVVVMERNGTPWVVYGDPTRPQHCTEV